ARPPRRRSGRRGASLHLLDAFTGGPLWSRPLPGAPLAGPALCGNVALVATCDPGGAGRPGITAIETATGVPLWRRAVPGLDRGFAWLPVDDRIVVNVAGGHAVALHAPTGDVAWEMRPGPDSPRDVPARLEPVLRGGALFLPAAAVHVVRPDDGEVIHRLDEGPVPDYLRVDERCHLYVGEHSGHMSAFGLVARLAVVK
ncbi:MAG: PQQ-binding-like beta-propeller repeat protein, partial [Myxococcota bacterium]|nr:PQQ-binding-like beta-propeller repeat protein [Myxococcota bacterium]